jgi:hypothetical protein
MISRENGGSGTRNFIIRIHPQLLLGRSSEGEWGEQGTWHSWERTEKCLSFWWESLKERDHSEEQVIDRKMGSEWILGRLAGGGDWILLAQDRDRWRAVVKAVMNLQVLDPRT